MNSIKVTLTFLILGLYCISCFGQTAPKRRRGRPDGISLGLGGVYKKSPYTRHEYQIRPIPMISIKYKRFILDGPRVQFVMFKNRKIEINNLIFAQLFRGYEAKDSSALVGMDKRKGNLDFGFKFKFSLRPIGLSLQFLKDIQGVHGGVQGLVSIGSKFPVSILIKKIFKLKTFPFFLAGIQYRLKYQDATFLNYYYGVKPSEVRGGRVVYTTRDTFFHNITGSLRFKATKKIMLIGVYSIDFLSKEIKNSPIVDEHAIYRIVTAASYAF